MKRFVCVVLAIVIGCIMCAATVVASDQRTDVPGYMRIDRDENLMEYQIAQAEYIDEIRDELQKEIEDYRAGSLSTYDYGYGGFSYHTGDIIVTRSTSSGGILGHAGIVISAVYGGCKVLEITPGYNNGKPAAISIETWFERYPTAYVLRSTYSKAMSAANYGKYYYVQGEGSNIDYSVLGSLTGTGDTYCSALVWRCFYHGANVAFEVGTVGAAGGIYYVPTQFLPYDFITFRAHNGLTAVHSVGW